MKAGGEGGGEEGGGRAYRCRTGRPSSPTPSLNCHVVPLLVSPLDILVRPINSSLFSCLPVGRGQDNFIPRLMNVRVYNC